MSASNSQQFYYFWPYFCTVSGALKCLFHLKGITFIQKRPPTLFVNRVIGHNLWAKMNAAI